MEQILNDHKKRYPEMKHQDILKLIYQHTLGCEHLIADPTASLAYLKQECATCTPTKERFVPIGNGLVRCHLPTDPELLNRFFVYTAKQTYGTQQDLVANIKKFCPDEAYIAAGCPAVHHSQAYRNTYRPAYRVVTEAFARYYEIFCKIETLLKSETPVFVAIDGMSASGKSTFGKLCKEVYDCNLFHTDDFFLQAHQRTPERLAEVGGNVDYRRFQAEILLPLQQNKAFSYRPYNCMTQSLDAPVSVEPKQLNIVEGAYSCHPYFGTPYHLRVCFTVDPQEQETRILHRNGPEMLKRFRNEWIPKENAYLQQMIIPTSVAASPEFSFLSGTPAPETSATPPLSPAASCPKNSAD